MSYTHCDTFKDKETAGESIKSEKELQVGSTGNFT